VVTFFNVFFENPKNMTFYVLLRCCTRFLEHWDAERYVGYLANQWHCCTSIQNKESTVKDFS